MCGANEHVRFTPNSDRESGLPQTAQKRTFAVQQLMLLWANSGLVQRSKKDSCSTVLSARPSKTVAQ
jgi:hypothetical protein